MELAKYTTEKTNPTTTWKNTQPNNTNPSPTRKATKRTDKETKLEQKAQKKQATQYPKGEDIPIEKANAELQTRNPRHIDIGGEGKYPNALNFTIGDAPNRVDGFAQKTLKNIDDKSVDLITIESAPTSEAILAEVARVLKQGGELRIKTPKDYIEMPPNKERLLKFIPDKLGFSLKDNKILKELQLSETFETFVELKFIKK